MLIGQTRERTRLSIECMLESANRLTFQLQGPALVLDARVLYQRMVIPPHSRSLPRETRES
jgi:hypothetical protein